MNSPLLDAIRRLAVSAIFFGLAACAAGLLYLIAAPTGALPSFVASRLPHPKPASTPPAPRHPAPPPLAMLAPRPISESGACISVDGFRSQAQAAAAKALFSDGPLRNKSWVVATPFPPEFSAGVAADNATHARSMAASFAKQGFSALSVGPGFVALAKADSPEAAIALVEESGAASGFAIISRLSSPGGERRAIVALPQTQKEIQFARSILGKLPGASISAAPCPEAAEPLLRSRAGA